MDNTDKYIEMCKMIHFEHEADIGDWYADDCYGLHVLGLSDFLPSTGRTHGEICNDNYTWLPRQDQLQEIVYPQDNVYRLHAILESFELFWTNPKMWGDYPFKTMEQLWLAFVMYEKYGKQWNGSKWVSE